VPQPQPFESKYVFVRSALHHRDGFLTVEARSVLPIPGYAHQSYRASIPKRLNEERFSLEGQVTFGNDHHAHARFLLVDGTDDLGDVFALSVSGDLVSVRYP